MTTKKYEVEFIISKVVEPSIFASWVLDLHPLPQTGKLIREGPS